MNGRLFIMMTIIFIGSASVAKADDQKACYSIEGMTCAACSITLKAGVKKLKGIAGVEASVEKKSAVVSFDPKQTSADAIGKKIDSIGYKSTVKECSKIEV